jgi:hypothetical protein
MPLPGFLQKIIDWLHAGYPEGVPNPDYIPLFALLATDLPEDDVTAFADELVSLSDEDTAKIIAQARASGPNAILTAADLARVRGRLAAGGWPLAKPDRSQPDGSQPGG